MWRVLLLGHGQWGNQDDLVLHFSLGGACAAEVAVRWPDAELSTQSFTVGVATASRCFRVESR
jgi:hypothetical protein